LGVENMKGKRRMNAKRVFNMVLCVTLENSILEEG